MQSETDQPMWEGECPFCERTVVIVDDPPRCPLCDCPIEEHALRPFTFPVEPERD